MTLDTRRFCGVNIDDRAGRKLHAGKCADSVIVARVAGEDSGLSVVIHNASFGSVGSDEIDESRTSMTLGATRRHDGRIVFVPMNESFGVGVSMRAGAAGAAGRAAMAKVLASEAAWETARAALTTFGGWGLAAEYHVERKLREATVFVFNNLLTSYIAERVLGLPKAF